MTVKDIIITNPHSMKCTIKSWDTTFYDCSIDKEELMLDGTKKIHTIIKFVTKNLYIYKYSTKMIEGHSELIGFIFEAGTECTIDNFNTANNTADDLSCSNEKLLEKG